MAPRSLHETAALRHHIAVALNELIQKLPIATTVVAFAFAMALFNRWQKRKEATHLAWWTLGIILYGAGTLTESAHAFLGWNEWIFRAWYIAGALLGAAPLAQGTVYLLLRKKTANQLSLVLLIAIMAGSICVLASPIDYTKVDVNRLTGSVFLWQWVRWFSPFINLYALVFLSGGAIYSAWRYGKQQSSANRCAGNVLIAAGALLPGIGGTFTRFGHTEWLYVTELFALILIWLGYALIKNDPGPTIHAVTRRAVGAKSGPN